MTTELRLLPEWAPQEAVLLAWPDKNTDWQPWLEQVQAVYLEIIAQLNAANTPVILLIASEEIAVCKAKLKQSARVLLLEADYNDTWIRDYGFLSCAAGQQIHPIEFIFNGWGDKFNAHKDNLINQSVLSQLCQHPLQSIDLVLEGGALEIDGSGHLLSTDLCLTNPKRNGNKTLSSYQQDFAKYLGASQSTIFTQGHLEGDDTDGHIDTLVRFTPTQGLVVQAAFNRPQDSHFAGLSALVEECKQAFPSHQIFSLPLPLIMNQQGQRLPASYANYLIVNQHILCPIYQQPEDELAMQVMAQAYPDYKIVPINCLPLVQQFGSLHCISMQVAKGMFKPEVVSQLQGGVQTYAK
ncbi:agmatine deiminase family protein [Paraglaciecola aestuariivivens]